MPSAPAAAALVAAASKVAAAENVGARTGLQKKSIILDAASIAAAKTTKNEKITIASGNFNVAVELKDIRPINVAAIIVFLSAIMQA